MENFFERLPREGAQELEQLSRLAFELREDRRRVLVQYGVASEDDLLGLIRLGEIPEHPAYDHYLGARALGSAREAVRIQLRAVMAELGG